VAVADDRELWNAVDDFPQVFEQVFDKDWEFTKDALRPDWVRQLLDEARAVTGLAG
jgi:hypothetical protein